MSGTKLRRFPTSYKNMIISKTPVPPPPQKSENLKTLLLQKYSNILKFIRPKPSNVYHCYNCKGIRLITRLCLGLSNLREHKQT